MSRSKYEPCKEIIITGEVPDKNIAQMLDCTPGAVRMARYRFLNADHHRKTNAHWRKANSKKELANTRAYRAKTNAYAYRHCDKWTSLEDELILTSDLGGKELAIKIGRNLNALYRRRYVLKNQKIHNIP